MIIDGLNQYLITYFSKHNYTESPIRKLEEHNFRTIIKLHSNIIVLEYNDDIYSLELVDNSGNEWVTLEDFETTNKEELFEMLAVLIEENRVVPTFKRVAINTEMIYNYVCERFGEVIQASQVAQALKLNEQEVLRALKKLKESGRLEQTKIGKLSSYNLGAVT